jgi:hypothetical protein
MNTHKLGPAILMLGLVLALFAAQFAQAEPFAGSEKAKTLQMIAPYRTWRSVNQQPILVQVDQMAPAG